MEVTFNFIYGLSFGLEYVAADEEVDILSPCVILDFACFRWIFELTNE
ncbi:MAG: hypothetical protein DDT31_00023 [Syntrophomonadaceae bacterium]|nr:hypothetical protein [Bacillota bacterium]